MKRSTPFIITLFCILTFYSSAQTITESPSLRGNGMQFIENRGQVRDMNNQPRPDILFVGDGGGSKIYLRKNGISYVIIKEDRDEYANYPEIKAAKQGTIPPDVIKSKTTPQENLLQGHRVDVDFIDANENFEILTQEPVEGNINYYFGKSAIESVNDFNKIIYKNIYDQIDVNWYGGKKNGLKYDIIVRPGGDPNNIKMQYTGAEKIEMKPGPDGGKLKVETVLGELIEYMPKVYQEIDGKIINVKAKYILNETILHFKLGNFNPAYPLVIDPWVTYYGGSDHEGSNAIATDNSGNVLVTGGVYSTNFPVTTGSFQTTNNGGDDIFVLKFDANGSRLWATYIGGSGGESGSGIATDAANNVVVTGATTSPDFPFTTGAFQTNLLGTNDAYLMKFDQGGTLLWSSYFGGSDYDAASAVDIDGANNILFSGVTGSLDLPITPGVFQTALVTVAGAGVDAFAAKFDANGNQTWTTYFGGSEGDFGTGITTNSLNEVVMVGQTTSSDLPSTPGAFQTAYASGPPGGMGFVGNAFMVNFDVNGNRQWASYFGGSGIEYVGGVTMDSNDDFTFMGYTNSPNLPVSPGCYQSSLGASTFDLYVAKFSSAGNRSWATYLWSGHWMIGAMKPAIDMYDNIYVMGEWEDQNPNTVYSCGYQKTFGGVEDQFIAKFDKLGNHICETYMGGSSEDDYEGGPGGLAAYQGNIYMTGTVGVNYPVTPGAFQMVYGGNPPGLNATLAHDVAIVKICGMSCGDTNKVINFSWSPPGSVCATVPINFSGTANFCGGDTSEVRYAWTFSGAIPASSTSKNPQGITFAAGGNYSVKFKVTTPCGADSVTNNITILNSLTSADVIGTTTLCANGTTTLTISNATSSNWSPGTGLSSINSPTVTSTPAGPITYTVTGMATNGCPYTLPVALTVHPLPVINISGLTSVCDGDSTTLTAGGANTYIWSTQGQTTSGITITITPTSNTSYTITGTDNNGCSNTLMHNITFNSLPVVSSTPNVTVCPGGSAILSAAGALTYVWQAAGQTGQSITINPTGNTSYTVTGIDNNGCSNTSVSTISITPAPAIQASNDTTICTGESVTLSASGNFTSYIWQPGGTTGSSLTITPGSLNNYSVTGTDANNCSNIAVVIVNIISVTASAYNNTTITKGQSISLTASAGNNYLWSPATGLNCITCQTPVATPDQNTLYCVTVSDANGCTDSACVMIIVEEPCKEFYIPNAFSPDADGQNDVFKIYGNSCIKNITLIIYDRWGEKVFETNDPKAAWNGTYKSKLLDAGVFAFTLNATLNSGESITRKGNITLLR